MSCEAARLADVLLNQPLSNAELQELTDFLGSDAVPDEAMDICMLDGFLTAIVIGPEYVGPGEWLPQIWGDAAAVDFGSLENAQRITELVTRFYNHIVRTFAKTPDEFFPALYEYEEDGKLKTSAEEWCIGFSLGVELRSDAWKPLMEDREFCELLSPIVAFSCEPAWKEVTAGRDPDEVREMLIEFLPVAVAAIHLYWQPERENGQKKASGVVVQNVRLGGGPKRGRNAPHPGGGKKPKQCSGRPVKR